MATSTHSRLIAPSQLTCLGVNYPQPERERVQGDASRSLSIRWLSGGGNHTPPRRHGEGHPESDKRVAPGNRGAECIVEEGGGLFLNERFRRDRCASVMSSTKERFSVNRNGIVNGAACV